MTALSSIQLIVPFLGLGVGNVFGENKNVNIPFLPDAASDIHVVWNPEAFFNTMVVNGNTWPVLEVAPEGYLFRLLNTADSRFLNLRCLLCHRDKVPADPATAGQVMKFVVNPRLKTGGGDPSTPPEDLVFDTNPGGEALLTVNEVTDTQDLALLEEESCCA